jgi:hypothetical protein
MDIYTASCAVVTNYPNKKSLFAEAFKKVFTKTFNRLLLVPAV